MAAILKKIIDTARQQESWSVSKKYNYGPIKYLEREVFKNGWTKEKQDLFYRFVHRVTDAKTYFVNIFICFDIYVYCGQIIYEMGRTFPEIAEETIYQWINETKEDHHVICS